MAAPPPPPPATTIPQKQVRFGWAPPPVLARDSARVGTLPASLQHETDQCRLWKLRVRWLLSPEAFSLHLWKPNWSSPTFVVLLTDLLHPAPAGRMNTARVLCILEYASTTARGCGYSVHAGFFDQRNTQQFLPRSSHPNALRFFAADPSGCIPFASPQTHGAWPPPPAVARGEVRVWIPLSRWVSSSPLIGRANGASSPTLPDLSNEAAADLSSSLSSPRQPNSPRRPEQPRQPRHRRRASSLAWTFQDEDHAKFWRSDWLLTDAHNQTASAVLDLNELPCHGDVCGSPLQTVALLKVVDGGDGGALESTLETVSLSALGRLLAQQEVPRDQWPQYVSSPSHDTTPPRAAARATFLPSVQSPRSATAVQACVPPPPQPQLPPTSGVRHLLRRALCWFQSQQCSCVCVTS